MLQINICFLVYCSHVVYTFCVAMGVIMWFRDLCLLIVYALAGVAAYDVLIGVLYVAFCSLGFLTC
jgi:hypothetical protein